MARQSILGRRGFDLAIDLGSDKKHQAADIEPGKENDYRSKRAIGYGVSVKEVEVDTQSERSKHPSENCE